MMNTPPPATTTSDATIAAADGVQSRRRVDIKTSANGETTNGPLAPRDALSAFLRALVGRKRSELTIRAYKTDVEQLLGWLEQNSWAPSID